MSAALVKDADRMMISANPVSEGIEFAFADGHQGLIPFTEIPGMCSRADLTIDLPSPYEIVIRNSRGEKIELPWDFARHFCDPAYRPRVEKLALAGRQALGARMRDVRKAAGLTQETLARRAGIGRATVARLEKGEYLPRLETLTALARALQRPVESLILGDGPLSRR